jgi:hypothetical protein
MSKSKREIRIWLTKKAYGVILSDDEKPLMKCPQPVKEQISLKIKAISESS